MKIYQSSLQNRDGLTIGFLLSICSIIFLIAIHSFIASSPVEVILALVGIIAIVYLILEFPKMFPFDVSITRKKIKIKSPLWFWSSLKVAKKNVKSIEFFQRPQAYMFSGWMINYETSQHAKIIRSKGNSGVIIKTYDGQKIVVFSKDLYINRETLLEDLKSAGWSVIE